jgi:hypothetical protein
MSAAVPIAAGAQGCKLLDPFMTELSHVLKGCHEGVTHIALVVFKC